MKNKTIKKFTNISCTYETRDLILNESKKTDTYDDFIRKLIILKHRHEKEFSEIVVEKNESDKN